ncbi:hypothetical protein J4Q44_G00023270 [Coregonus suidteri]|uniref:Ig-like domain-containing protein n=1 Tax=Coregonus suidteri TaxID=861788 RepID=A0AAN8MGI0_9TELE
MGETRGRVPHVLLLALIQGVLSSSTVEVLPSENPACAGNMVTLTLSPATQLQSGSWAVGGTQILTWSGGQQAVFPSHNGRASVNVSTGTLTLTSITVADSGVFVVQSTSPQLTATSTLTVLEPVSALRLVANNTGNLVEFKSSVSLFCSSSGSSLSYRWLNGNSEVTASDGIQLGDGNSTLTIVNVTRYNDGPFRCNAFNAVSNGTTEPLHLNISYGPDGVSFTVNRLNTTTSFLIGSTLTMSCSAQSNPQAEFQWAFNGKHLNGTSPDLKLYSAVESQSGLYSCLAFNNRTMSNSNVTRQITISSGSVSVQLGVSVWLVLLLSSLAGVLF